MRRAVLPAALAAAVASCAPAPAPSYVEVLFGLDARRASPTATGDAARRELGARLFSTGFVGGSGVSCHPRDGLGADGSVHGVATPPLVDVARQARFGWRGEQTDLTAFVEQELARVGVADDEAARLAVAELVGPEERVTRRSLAEALAAELATWRSDGAWDRFVEGDAAALSADARRGLDTFVEVGCAACHGGRTLGGVSVHELGAAEPYPPGGRYRAPMLRRAASTAPYLHDGSLDELADVVRVMGRHELGVQLDDGQVAAIVAFLREIDGAP